MKIPGSDVGVRVLPLLAWLVAGCATGHATVRPVLSGDARSGIQRAIDSMATPSALRTTH